MLQIHKASREDVGLLYTMILEFAEFERFREYVTITEEILARDGFGPNPRFHALTAHWEGEPAAYAIYYYFYSSFEGPAVFLEDVYVREEFRGKGIGKALMAEVAAVAVREGFWGVRWEVLDWNTPAIEFYRRLGATIPDEWKPVRLEGAALHTLATWRVNSQSNLPIGTQGTK
jgi:GNAT superfamily N-acetyltransferase